MKEIRIFLKEKNIEDNVNQYFSIFKRLGCVTILTSSIMSLNFAISTTFALNITLPGQIYFVSLLITQIGELTSCPLYVIVYGFNNQRFQELKRIILCNNKERMESAETFDSVKKDIDSEISIDIKSDTDYQ